MNLREAAEQECRKSGRSMRRIAIQAGLEPGLFNAYLQGKRPNRRNAERVAAALGMAPRELFQNLDQLRPY